MHIKYEESDEMAIAVTVILVTIFVCTTILAYKYMDECNDYTSMYSKRKIEKELIDIHRKLDELIEKEQHGEK